MAHLEQFLTWAQLALLAPLTVLGLHRGWMVLVYLRTRGRAVPPAPDPEVWPTVTVQLPIFNERYVAARLIETVAALDYPQDRLQIQVLDDSTDDTTEIVERSLRRLPAGLRVQHLRRAERTGFKAGALAAGLRKAEGELLAVFDADFVPPRDFLRRMVPHLRGARTGMVQARWDHLNADYSALTDVQATLLDGHFIVEHTARSRSGCLFNFNGTAGVFRRACIEDAGGWQHDTLTEDMDLSYRAQLRGWRFVYLPDVTCPAELPIDVSAFLSQQHRWAKGSLQTARKLLPRILRAPIGVAAKIEAGFHLLGNLAFPLLLGLILVALPLQVARRSTGNGVPTVLGWIEGLPLLLATTCLFLYYGIARRQAGRFGIGSAVRLPAVLAIGAGLSVNNTAAVLSAFGRRTGTFRRTPKRAVVEHTRSPGRVEYHSRRGLLPWIEITLAAWASTTACFALSIGLPATGAFHALFAAGLAWVGAGSLREDLRATRVPSPRSCSAGA